MITAILVGVLLLTIVGLALDWVSKNDQSAMPTKFDLDLLDEHLAETRAKEGPIREGKVASQIWGCLSGGLLCILLYYGAAPENQQSAFGAIAATLIGFLFGLAIGSEIVAWRLNALRRRINEQCFVREIWRTSHGISRKLSELEARVDRIESSVSKPTCNE